MRKLEKYLEKKRWKKGGSKWEKLREWKKKRNCPFDAKKVCPVTCSFLKIADLTIDEAYAHKYLETVSDVHHFKTSSWKDVKVSIYI